MIHNMSTKTSTIPSSKLHCCFLALILFIVAFLSLPLFLIKLANNDYVEKISICNRTASKPAEVTSMQDAQSATSWLASGWMNGTRAQATNSIRRRLRRPRRQHGFSLGFNDKERVYNCSNYEPQSNLQPASQNGHCPLGWFLCTPCSNLCVQQACNCDKVSDCPDRSDEETCLDTNGVMQHVMSLLISKEPNETVDQLPDSCDKLTYENNLCPCNLNDGRVITCSRSKLTGLPAHFRFRSTVTKIRLDNNQLESLPQISGLASLGRISLEDNLIRRLEDDNLAGVEQLRSIVFTRNRLNYIGPRALAGAPNLRTLILESNQLVTFDSRILKYTPHLSNLYLSANKIELPEWTNFSICNELKVLLIEKNRLSHVRSHWFSNMPELIWLSLADNQIDHIEPGAFNWNYDLKQLDLSRNRIKTLARRTFYSSLNLERLELDNNPLERLPEDAFWELNQLKSLNLDNVALRSIQPQTFLALKQLKFIYFAKFHYCHYAAHVRVCFPTSDFISSDHDLLAFPILKHSVWIGALVCSLGNVFVLVWRTISSRGEERSLSLFVRNLSVADLMMAVYLATIGWQDQKYKDQFKQHAFQWISSWQCKAVGFLAVLSCELSVFILTLITIERYRSIVSIDGGERGSRARRARFYLAGAWLLAGSIASYPLFENTEASNSLCLPLHIDQPSISGWQSLYLGLNFSAVLLIMGLYMHMYSMIISGRQLSRPAQKDAHERREDVILAVRFFFIVLTDCLCWIPVVVIKLLALANVNISATINSWLVIFIIPINSALNPIVYTLAAPSSTRDALCRLLKRICVTPRSSSTTTTTTTTTISEKSTRDRTRFASTKPRPSHPKPPPAISRPSLRSSSNFEPQSPPSDGEFLETHYEPPSYASLLASSVPARRRKISTLDVECETLESSFWFGSRRKRIRLKLVPQTSSGQTSQSQAT